MLGLGRLPTHPGGLAPPLRRCTDGSGRPGLPGAPCIPSVSRAAGAENPPTHRRNRERATPPSPFCPFARAVPVGGGVKTWMRKCVLTSGLCAEVAEVGTL
ncbi:60S ribosomal protein L38 isoform X1 [Harpia harpyja]|uniref:60S ribosomal protein L38 isoform X1 n=1 Tax=Harpia harpyja TaxID=202280 RepID=UPI0022B0AF61|nr:60S ribosomal protein L38 isoform X1 [Harpia harpyja]